eukprot:scaffold15271_cov110-Isochrysis_galbana.AAC.8
MEVEPADARPASSASGPADTAPTDMSAQKRPRDPAPGNMVSSSPMQKNAPAMPATCEPVCVDNRWAPLCVGLQSRSTSTQIAERQRTACWRGVYLSSRLQTVPPPRGLRASDITSLQKQAPYHIPSAHPPGAEKLPQSIEHGHFYEFRRQTVSQQPIPIPPYATRSKILNLTFPPPTHPQKGVNKAPPMPPPTSHYFVLSALRRIFKGPL